MIVCHKKDGILSYDGVDCNVKENHELSYQNVQQRESDLEARETGFM